MACLCAEIRVYNSKNNLNYQQKVNNEQFWPYEVYVLCCIYLRKHANQLATTHPGPKLLSSPGPWATSPNSKLHG